MVKIELYRPFLVKIPNIQVFTYSWLVKFNLPSFWPVMVVFCPQRNLTAWNKDLTPKITYIVYDSRFLALAIHQLSSEFAGATHHLWAGCFPRVLHQFDFRTC